MRILHVITGLSRGGAEHSLYKLLAAGSRSGCAHAVISLMEGGPYAEKIEALGVPVFQVGMRRGLPGPAAYPRLRAYVRDSCPDLVHGWMYHGALAALLSGSGRPVIVGVRHSLHDLDHDRRMTRVIISLLARLSRRSARVLYCSQAARIQHEAVGYPASRGVVIPNGFDSETFRPDPHSRTTARLALGLDPGTFVLGHVGRFHAVKDHENLLRAFGTLVREQSGCRLVMIGTGVDERNQNLCGLIDALQLRGQVTLLGERDDVPEIMNAFDLLVNASRGEAFPNVLGEAMACGVPCVATDVGDSAEIIADTGSVVPARDPVALAEAVSAMVELEPEARAALGARARARIVKQFSMARFVERHEALYEAVLEETTHARR